MPRQNKLTNNSSNNTKTVEEAVEEPLEEAVEEPVEEAVEEPVEEAVEEPVEEAVEEAVEEPVEEAEQQTNDKGLTKPAITRLARRAGVKSMSDDCITPIKHLVAMKLDELLSTAVVINSQHTTKTIMADDVYEALAFTGVNVARTEEF